MRKFMWFSFGPDSGEETTSQFDTIDVTGTFHNHSTRMRCMVGILRSKISNQCQTLIAMFQTFLAKNNES
jgi:hypothetical protein